MLDYNRGTKKFVSVLEKLLEKMRREIVGIIEDNLSKKVSFELVLSTKSNEDIFAENAGTKENIGREYKLLEKKNPELGYRYNKLNWIYLLITEGHAFNEYDILESLFEELKFDPKYQIEVLGYLLKHAATSFIKLNKEIEKRVEKVGSVDKEFFQCFFDKEIISTGFNFDKKLIQETIENMLKKDFVEDILKTVKKYEVIDKFIDENGYFIGSNDINQLVEALDMKQNRITQSQKELIIKNVKNLTEQQKIETKIESKEDANAVIMPTKKEQHQATLLLKRLLDQDKPKAYIDEEAITAITNAMIILNYSDKSIAKIQKNIISNNIELENNRLKNKLEIAKREFLTPAQLSLLNSIEALVNSNEPLINSFYETIVENQKFIKQELINMYDNKDDSDNINMNKDLIALAFEEIKTAIDGYCYSDYRFVLELTKKETE